MSQFLEKCIFGTSHAVNGGKDEQRGKKEMDLQIGGDLPQTYRWRQQFKVNLSQILPAQQAISRPKILITGVKKIDNLIKSRNLPIKRLNYAARSQIIFVVSLTLYGFNSCPSKNGNVIFSLWTYLFAPQVNEEVYQCVGFMLWEVSFVVVSHFHY